MGNLTNRELFVLPEDVNTTVQPPAYRHTGTGLRQSLSRFFHQLVEPSLMLNHVVIRDHPLLLKAEHIVQLPGLHKRYVGVFGFNRRLGKPLVDIRQVLLGQESIGILDGADVLQAQLFDESILVDSVVALHPPLCLWQSGPQ